MIHLKTFEQSVFDTIKKTLKDPLKKGGMYLITNSDEFKELTRLKDIQQQKLDTEIKKYGEVYTSGGEAAEQMVDMYNQNVTLLDTTIEQYISQKIDKDQVIKILDKKIKEVQAKPTLGFKDAEAFKKSALDLLNWLRSDVAKWLI